MYYQNIDFQTISTNALIAPNFIGLGLPLYAWNQVVSLLFQTGLTNGALTTNQMTCNPDYGAGVGGYCTL